MRLPFSQSELLDLFADFNSVMWPVALVLWATTCWLAWRWISGRELTAVRLFALLAVHWAWSGVVFHWLFFRRINPGAVWFSLLFVAQAAQFAWLATVTTARFRVGRRPRDFAGVAFVCYGLAYPLVNLALGMTFPRAPLFAVPCPTTLITAGFILTLADVPRWLSIGPIIWSVIGGSAALLLGVAADLPLIAAAVLLALNGWAPTVGHRVSLDRSFGSRRTS